MKKIMLGITIAILLVGIVCAYTSSSPQTTLSGSSLSTQSESFCQQGSDFIVQIVPLGCSPAVIRSDLLEENNVPVYCQLMATKINPLIQVKSIDSITFSGKYSPQVSGIAFYPAKAALSGENSNSGLATSGNIGYVKIMLKKQNNESSMPNFVTGNLTAKIKYDVETLFGIGNGVYYLPEFSSESEWEQNKNRYGFWNGKGYLQAENIDENSADISIYSTTGKISTVSLEEGKTSNSIYLPGFECQAGLKVTLQDIQNPDTKARLRINSDTVEVGENEKFLNNKCTVKGVSSKGLIQTVTFRCQEDSGAVTHALTMSPRVSLSINGIKGDYTLGDKLYSFEDKEIYLGYIGSRGDFKDKNNLFIYLYASPSQSAERLTDNQLQAISTLIGNSINNGKAYSGGIISASNELLKSFSATINMIGSYIISGEDFYGIGVLEGRKNLYGKDIQVAGYADAQDKELSNDATDYYENAKADYEEIQSSFSEEKYSSNTYGEISLYNEIDLASKAGQQITTSELCKKFEENYPASTLDTSDYCNSMTLSNSEVDGIYITVNKQTLKVSFDGIYTPGIEDFSAAVTIGNANDYSGTRTMTKGEKVYVSSTEYFSLVNLDVNSAVFEVSGIKGTISQDVFKDGKATVKKGESVTIGSSRYKISLNNINLKRIAKVYLKSNVDNTGTEANFSFKIGIEKRAPILTPSVVKDMISDLSKKIEGWEKISTGLDKVNKVLKTSCLATGAALVVKNFLLGTTGEGMARKQIMSGKGGWSSICADKVASQEYISLDQCYLDNSDKIDQDVSDYARLMQAQNNEIKGIEAGVTTQDTFGAKVVNTDKFMTEDNGYIETAKDNINLDSTISDPSGNGDDINLDNLMNNVITSDGYKGKVYSVDQLKEIELYSKIINDPSASQELKDMANKNLYSVLTDIQSNANSYQLSSSFSQELKNNGLSSIGATDSYGNSKAITGAYNGGTVSGSQLSGLDAGRTYPAQSITYNNEKYILVLQSSSGGGYFIEKVYSGDTLEPVSGEEEKMIKSAFRGFNNAGSYKNVYKNAELSYYETEPYSGLPAIVPFDKTNGWYAAISQTLPTGNNIAAYSASGKVTSFWVCNVGPNGLEENKGGDDICEMINTGTGQPYNQFPGLSEGEATKIINNANKAIEQASNAYSSSKSGTVKVLGENFKVGKPAANIPDFQCQDFMSPKDCNLLFNLCDPVICPSSRCDLGGEYPVKDVIQTGIVGSLVLCLPNVQEGILIPVCLTGVQAGIDNLVSVQKSYRDCLNESLATGKMVGICDEIYSLYLCDFLWKQAIPIAGMIVPAIITTLSGENVRGGGEYLNVVSSWGAAEQSVNYLVNYYGANSKSAFTARSSELVSDEVCKMYASATVPTGADFFDTLIASDSPPQYTARFDEIQMTTATASPTSQYKVYFHIYAGKDSGVYYQVYLKGSSDSSYYRDTSQSLAVDSGYVTVGSQVDKTKDIIGVSGYKQLCININGEEECGFAQVSTSFLSDFVTDEYLASAANETNIKKTSDCVSGTANMYSLLLNLNPQAAAQSLINPAIYNQGIIRVCATEDPGKGTDSYSGTENSRWKAIGYCDNQNIKCWIDTDSIKEVIKSTYLQNQTISSISDYYTDILSNQYGYLTEEEFNSAVSDIKNEKDASERISLINTIIDKVFLNNEKANLLLLRGNAYSELLKAFLETSAPIPASVNATSSGGSSLGTSSGGSSQTGEGTVLSPEEQGTTTDSGLTTAEKDALNSIRQKILAAADNVIATDSSNAEHCFDAVEKIYTAAGAKISSCIYSDNEGKTYSVGTKSMTTAIGGRFQVYGSWCTYHDKSQTVKLGYLQPGDIISYTWIYENGSLAPHSAIFIKWEDQGKRTATLFDWNGLVLKGQKTDKGKTCGADIPTSRIINGQFYCKVYRYYEADLSDTAHPVYVIFSASSSGTNPSDLPTPFESIFQEGSLLKTSGSTAGTTSIAEKIYEHAKAYADANSQVNSLSMVINSLKSAGITGFQDTDYASSSFYQTFIFSLKNSNFYKIEVNKNLKKGDIVFIDDGCKMNFAVGVVENVTSNGLINTLYVYTNFGSKVELRSFVVYNSPKEDIGNGNYIYKAYRYVGDLSSSDKSQIQQASEDWTVTSALDYINQNNLEGKYSDNEVFINQLVFDSVLSQTECDTVKGTGLFALQKDIPWLKSLLLSKKTGTGSSTTTTTPTTNTSSTASSGTSSGNVVSSVAQKIYEHAKAYADANSKADSLDLVFSSLKSAGASDGISDAAYAGFIYSLNQSSNFYKIEVNKNLKRGDIVFISDGCNAAYAFGVVDNVTTGNVNTLYVYTNFGNKVEKKSFVVYDNFKYGGLSGNYAYKAYRYVGGLSSSDKNSIQKAREDWTVTSALDYISLYKLTGNYGTNIEFMNQLVYDRVLTQSECDTMDGGLLGIGQKDIIWLKTLLLSKKASA
jgi:hypothetical protein